MADIFTVEPPADDAAAEAAIGQMILHMKELRAQMVSDQAEIERLKVETAALRGAGETLKAETRTLLATLDITA
jgi:hypothetical protein